MISRGKCWPLRPLRMRSAAPIVCSILLSACGGSGGDTTEAFGIEGAASSPPVAEDGSPVAAADDSFTTLAVDTGPADFDTASPDNPAGGSGSVPQPEPSLATASRPLAAGAAYPPESDCSVTAQKQFVNAAMHDYYYWSDYVPSVDSSAYATPKDLLEALKVDPPDHFSGILSVSEASRFVEGIHYDYGFVLGLRADGAVAIAQTFFESPAYLAVIRRGDHLLAINDVAFEAWTKDDLLALLSGNSPDNPQSARFTLVDKAGAQRTVSLTTAAYPKISVPQARVLELDTGMRVGYLQFDTFTDNAVSGVAHTVKTFREYGVDELVVDLRYNRGGRLLQVLENLTQLAGNRFAGQLAASIRYNDQHAAQNDVDMAFPSTPDALDMNRLVFLVSKQTASAAEFLINSLKPYIEVVVIGNDRTAGKAFGFSPNSHCDTVLFAVEYEYFNAAGETVACRITPDCWVENRIFRERGDPSESMLAGALNYLYSGTCVTSPDGLPNGRMRDADKGVTRLPPPRVMPGLW